MSVACGAQAGKHGHDAALRNGRHQFGRAFPDFGHALRRDGCIVFIGDGVGVRPHNGVAVRRLHHHNALARFIGHREEDSIHVEVALVEQIIFTAPRRDLELRAHPGFVHHFIGVNAGGIDHPAAGKIAAVGLDANDLLALKNKIYKRRIGQHFHTVLNGIF
ncbi:hypothetical protein SDC9_155398 [bioreactor metagenome]|uniref:Uncharacterized protein n=1 Tax=bioreactor metagenome TaxID=1076179 RepID=A0A645F2S1_9ZZZZ